MLWTAVPYGKTPYVEGSGHPGCCKWALFGTFFALFGNLGVPFATRGHPEATLRHTCDTFWHPWGQGGPPGRTRGLPLGTFCTTFVAPWSKNGAKSWQKFGFIDFVKMSVSLW